MYASCSSHGPLLSKQKRPAAVARFLNRLPLEERHAATNILLFIGLRAYTRVIATAPADLESLRAAAMEPLENNNNNNNNNKTEVIRDSGSHQESEEMETSEERPRGRGRGGSFRNNRIHEKETLDTPPRKIEKTPILNKASILITPKTPILNVAKVTTPVVSPSIYNNKNSRLDERSPSLRGLSGLNSSRVSSSKSRHSQTPALSFILGDVLQNLVGEQISSHRVRITCASSSSVLNIPPIIDDQSTNHDLSVYDVSDGTGDETENTVDAMIGVSVNANPNSDATFNSNYSEDYIYPIEFLHHMKKHIESTRGVRENPLLVAASLPQSLSIYTMHRSFNDLYRSLLVSYHLNWRWQTQSPQIM